MCNANLVKNDRGQISIILALAMPVLILFTGMAIDAGLLYVTKARLSTAVDAGCLTGVNNLSQGQTTAAALATDIFNANFGPNPPTPSVTFPVDGSGNQQVKVTATAYVHTLFMQSLSQWTSVPVSATAVATRGKLIMTIVLDRSGSMCGGTEHCDSGVTGDQGGQALKSAVPLFINNFNDTTDEIGMTSFSSNATVHFATDYTFKTAINTAVSNLTFTGGTFGTGAGTSPIQSNTIGAPLSLAQQQNNAILVQAGQNVVKVIVYFTDGLMNTIQDKIYCKGTSGNITDTTLLNYGGHDSGSQVDFFDPTTATADWGHYTSGTGFPYTAEGDICKNKTGAFVTKFPSQQSGTQVTFSQSAVTTEAQWRATQTAIAMRTESPIPTYIFTIGLGSGVSTTTQAFLAKLANDPKYPATYIKGQPAGMFFYIASCTGTDLPACRIKLNTAFQTIAASVLLRLTG